MANKKSLGILSTLGLLGLLIGGGAGAASAYWHDSPSPTASSITAGDLKVEITGLPTITHDCDGKAEPVKGGTAFVEPGEAYKVTYPVRITAEGKNIAVKTSGTGEVTDKSGKKLGVVHGTTEGFLIKSVKADGEKDTTLGGLIGSEAPPAKVLEDVKITGEQVRDG
ncbi:MAG: hypothetical protein Q618_VCMC00003G0172 [Varibaculum cambriense DORA_20]|uniref:hypothetical protein n=1 Tax=Varibaculum cambriense TaxID=184870 RepID=UPI0003D5F1B1|nr:hypothetical protein [Varibaculum cambriense]ETI81870.1 MAG: hypothetical protein Q618_VCMC00003G0172 [Varibaculum cambriense DORA_20]